MDEGCDCGLWIRNSNERHRERRARPFVFRLRARGSYNGAQVIGRTGVCGDGVMPARLRATPVPPQNPRTVQPMSIYLDNVGYLARMKPLMAPLRLAIRSRPGNFLHPAWVLFGICVVIPDLESQPLIVSRT